MNNSHRNDHKSYGNNAEARLWKPLQLGNKTLKHRIAMAPLTRMRATDQLPNDLMVEYYRQRATDGGLIVSEATFISKEAGGYPNAPGIYNQEQVDAWKLITDAVHEKGGVIYCQLWAIGRANNNEMPDVKVVSASSTPYEGGAIPEEMTVEDIHRYIQAYENATRNAMKAGFDGVEIHAAHGYLLDQFLQESSNNTRNDKYSGPLENRARFTLEVLERVTSVIGEERCAIRFSPFSAYSGMGAEDPFETWGWLMEQVKLKAPKLAYVSVTDPRMDTELGGSDKIQQYSSDYFHGIFRGSDLSTISKFAKDNQELFFPDPDENHPTVVFGAGGYSASDAEGSCERTGGLIAYGRFFIANPDLVLRLKFGFELNPYHRSTFYSPGAVGYTDYPVANDNTKIFVPPTEVEKLNAELEKLRSTNEGLVKKVESLKTETVINQFKKEMSEFKTEILKQNVEIKTQLADLKEANQKLIANVLELKSDLDVMKKQPPMSVSLQKQPPSFKETEDTSKSWSCF